MDTPNGGIGEGQIFNDIHNYLKHILILKYLKCC